MSVCNNIANLHGHFHLYAQALAWRVLADLLVCYTIHMFGKYIKEDMHIVS